MQFTSYISAMKALEGMNAKKLKGRPVAVDWVVPKEKYELSLREKGGGVEEEEGEGGEMTSQSDSMNEQSLGEKREEEEEEMDEGESDEARSEREEDDSSSEGRERRVKPICLFIFHEYRIEVENLILVVYTCTC